MMIQCYYAGTARPKPAELHEKVILYFARYWRDIGVFLEIQPEELRIIDKDFSGKCRDCCYQMLDKWLETTPSASWSQLAEAVYSAIKPLCKGASIIVQVH